MDEESPVKRFLSTRDPEAFRDLVEACQSKVFRLVCSILGPYRDGDAEDVTQEVFVQVFTQAARLREPHHFATWLYRIAYNRALDHRKRARFRLPHAPAEALNAMPASGSLPLDQAEGAERRRIIAQCLEALPETYRTLLYLYYWQGASVEEAGEYLGLTPGTVKSYLMRGRQRMQRELAKKGIGSDG
jgi:RNA polymerase sigma-70 factor (ECF subfamily)